MESSNLCIFNKNSETETLFLNSGVTMRKTIWPMTAMKLSRQGKKRGHTRNCSAKKNEIDEGSDGDNEEGPKKAN